MRLVVGICGASGVHYAVGLLRALKDAGVEVHLVMSPWAERVLKEETRIDPDTPRRLAAYSYEEDDMAAPISSSSFLVDGMVVIPATVKTLGEIANSIGSSLMTRAAENVLKTRGKLVLCPRETPLSTLALRNMYELSLAGAVVLPLSPGFYHRPADMDDLTGFMVGKVLDVLGIDHSLYRRWGE